VANFQHLLSVFSYCLPSSVLHRPYSDRRKWSICQSQKPQKVKSLFGPPQNLSIFAQKARIIVNF